MNKKLASVLVGVIAATAALISHPAAAAPVAAAVPLRSAPAPVPQGPNSCSTAGMSIVNISAPGTWLGIIPTGIPQGYPQTPNYMLLPEKRTCSNWRNPRDQGMWVGDAYYWYNFWSQSPAKQNAWGYHIGSGWCAKYFISTYAWGGQPSYTQGGYPGLRFYGWMYEGAHWVDPNSAVIYVEQHPLNTGWC